MTRHALALTAVSIALATLVLAQGAPPTPTPVPPDPGIAVRDQAVRNLAAWKRSDARAELEPKQQSLASSPAFKTAWGLLRAEEGKLDEALTKLTEAANADPKDPAAAYYKGEVLRWQKKDADAKTAWQAAHDRAKAALAAKPTDAYAMYYLGASLLRLQKYAEARTKLNEAAAAGYDAAQVNYQIGMSYAFEKSWQAAKEALDKTITANPSFAHAYYYRGRVWRELKKTDQMMNDLDRFLKLAPDAPEAGAARSLLGAGGG